MRDGRDLNFFKKEFKFKKLRKSKKGSHVDVIISFAIFVTFLLFLILLIQPALNVQRDKKIIMDNFEKKLLDKSQGNLTIVSVKLGSTTSNCVSLENLFSESGAESNIFVKGESGNSVDSSLVSLGSDNLQIERTNTLDNFFKIYYSEEFDSLEENILSCETLIKDSGYELSLIKKDKYLFEEKILSLINSYSDYESLKEEFNFPNNYDFGFGLIYQNGTLVSTFEEEFNTNVYVGETRIKYVSLNGEILSGYLRTKIW